MTKREFILGFFALATLLSGYLIVAFLEKYHAVL